jgi:hypothetical protein
VAAIAVAVCSSADALADTKSSANWAGYASHRSGVRFKSVSAVWRQPNVSCVGGRQSYSAYWIGLGGYSLGSNALEQIGTEMDCSPSGRAVSSAWYELIPAPSVTIGLRVRAGDLLAAKVTVDGHTATLTLINETTRRTFSKRLHASSVDVSSAEWIVEAPSDCITIDSCQTLPLANFGATSFYFAGATSTRGHSGPISDPNWRWTKINLSPGGRRFVVANGAGPTAGAATATGLAINGSAFTVNYSQVSVQGNPFLTTRHPAIDGRLVHPAR